MKYKKGMNLFVGLSLTAVLALCPINGFASNDNSTDNLSNAVASTQQTNTVSGIVRDNTGEPLIGVSVVLKSNHRVGTVTNMDGHYSINVPSGSTLVFSLKSADNFQRSNFAAI